MRAPHDPPVELAVLDLVLAEGEELGRRPGGGQRRQQRRAGRARRPTRGQRHRSGASRCCICLAIRFRLRLRHFRAIVRITSPGVIRVRMPPPTHHLAEHRVGAVEMGLRAEVDEPLAIAGVRARERHAEHRRVVPVAVDLVPNGAAGAAEPVAARIAVLHDEVGHHPVPAVPVEEAPVHQPQEVVHRERRVGAEQLDLDRPAPLRLDHDVRARERVGGREIAARHVAIVLQRAAGRDRIGRPPPCRGLGPVVLGPPPDQIVAGPGRPARNSRSTRPWAAAPLCRIARMRVERREGRLGKRVAPGRAGTSA